jgi:hypothetical protein
MSTDHIEPVVVQPPPNIGVQREVKAEPEKVTPTAGSRSHTWNWHDALYIFILVLLVIGMAWLYTPNITGEVLGMWWDPLLNIWTMGWDTNSLLHHPSQLWQGQLLYPNSLTLSYSENLLGEALFFAPIYLLTHNPVLAYNVTFYLTFLLCGTNMYIAARYYTGKPFAAFIAALIYAFAPYRVAQIDHIHIVAGEWIPLAFLYLDRSLQDSKSRHWILFGLFYLLQLLSSIYYAIFLTYTLLAYLLIRYSKGAVVQLREQRGTYVKQLARQAIKPCAVLLGVGIILFILMRPYLASLHNGFVRSAIESASYSAFIRDFLFTAPFNTLYGVYYYNGVKLPLDGEHFLFIGWTIIVLIVFGLVLAFRKHNVPLRAFAWTGLIVLLFAFGPFLQYSAPHGTVRIPTDPYTHPFSPAIPMPWFLAYYVLPGFKGVRVPARLMGVLLLVLALLSAYGVAWLQEMLATRWQTIKDEQGRKRARRYGIKNFVAQGILIVLPFVLLLEALPSHPPVTHVPTGSAIPAAYQWLAAHDDKQPVVELPMAHLDENFTQKDEAWYDYYALYHNHPIVNGWSGYRPNVTTTISALLLKFPSADSIAILERYHVKYVVVHPQWYLQYESSVMMAEMLAQMQANTKLHLLTTFGNNIATSDSVWQVL